MYPPVPLHLQPDSPDSLLAFLTSRVRGRLHVLLCLSPVGLSMVTKLSVKRIAAMMMGVWFLSSAFASYVGGMIAGAMAINDNDTGAVDALTSLAIYSSVFEKLAWVAIGLAFVVLAL